MTKSVTGPRQGVLTYHEVGATPSGYVYSVSAAQLDDHVRSLKSQGVLFTFDDGHQSHLHQAAPVLEKYGTQGLFFVTAGWTESRPGYLSWPELRELAARGHRIQAHGWSHKFLTNCADAQLYEELERTKKTLEDRVGCPVDSISAPGGRWNRRVAQACEAAGYSRLYVSVPWDPRSDGSRIQVLGRIMVRRTMDLAALQRLLHLGRRDRGIAQLRQAAKYGLQLVLGDRIYKLAWNLLGGRSLSDHDGL